MANQIVHRETGFVLELAAIVIAGMLLLVFGSLQYTKGVEEGLLNYYVTIVASQQMQANTPFKQSSLDAGSWVARLHGYTGVQAIEGPQVLPGVGEINLSYDATQVPNVVFVRAKRRLSLMAGMLSFLGGSSGLSILESSAEMGGKSEESFISVHADVSISMQGPPLTSTNPPVIEKMLQAFGIPVTNNLNSTCFPIDVSDATTVYPTMAPAAARQRRCRDYSRLLPFFYNGRRALPVNWNLNKPFPYPQHTLPGTETNPTQTNGANDPLSLHQFHEYNPALDYSETLSGVPHPDRPTPSNPQYENWDNIATCAGPPLRLVTDPAYPGIKVACGRDHPLIPGKYMPCFPLDDPNDQFSILFRPGYRLNDFDQSQSSCRQSTAPCARMPYKLTDFPFCVRPWNVSTSWMTQREFDACQGVSTGPETPPIGGCDSQLGLLAVRRSDFFDSFLKLTQSFMITLSETVPLLNFSAFAGPTFWGNIANPYADTHPEAGGRVGGNKKLFDSSWFPNGHLFVDTIDERLAEVVAVPIVNNSGLSQMIGGNLGLGQSASIRFTHMLSYLHHGYFPTMNPIPALAPPDASGGRLTPAAHSYPGTNFLSPLENGARPFVSAANYPGTVPPGRAGTWQLGDPAWNPATLKGAATLYLVNSGGAQLGYPERWDYYNPSFPVPNRFFPLPAPFSVDPSILSFWGPVHTSYTSSPLFAGSAGLYDVFPLQEIDYSSGVQTGLPYESNAETWIKNLAPVVFNYLQPTSGGTDTLSVFEDMLRSYPGGNKPAVGVVITDGKPNLPCADELIPNYLTCEEVDFDTHLNLIQQKLQLLDEQNFFIILLYINHPTLAGDPEVDQFKSLFTGHPRRVLLEFSFTDTQSFTQKFKESLTIVKALIISATKQLLN